MDLRGFNDLLKSLLLPLLFSQCCHPTVYSQNFKTFDGLSCRLSENCTYGVQDCHLIRCACPYETDKYNSNATCLDDVCPENCCSLVPNELQNHTATHFMLLEKYEKDDLNETIKTFQIFTKLDGSSKARWLRTVFYQQPDLNHVYVAEAISAQNLSNKLSSGETDFLDNQGEAPDEVFGVSLDSVDHSKGFSVPLQCHDGINTSCENNFCSCLKFSRSNEIPSINLLADITGGNILFDVGNDKATVTTSSSLTAYHYIDVTNRPSKTIAGWAPFFNDSSSWVEFSDVQADVCGVVVQGVDWATSRRLDRFTVTVDGNLVQSQDGQNYFQSGMVLDSKNFHLFSKPTVKPTSLRINVLKPDNHLNVGFRASLITCGDATSTLKDLCIDNSLAESTKQKAENILAASSTNDPESQAEKDQVELVGNIYESLKTFLEVNFQNYTFPEGSRFRVDADNAEIDVYFVDKEELKKSGYSFNNSDTTNASDDGSYARIDIPSTGFSTDDIPNEIVIVVSVVGDKERETKDIQDKKRTDNYDYHYAIVSPVVTVTVFVNGSGYGTKEIIKKMKIRIPYKNTTKSPMPFYFEEADVADSGGIIMWSTKQCNSSCNKLYCEMRCNHATSFAVLQLLGQSKLSEAWRRVSSILTSIGCVVSIISLMVALVIYLILRSSIASVQYAVHSNLMISLLIALCIFMLLLIKEKSLAMCSVIKFLLQYFFSAAFCWMLCEGIHLYRQIITVFESESKYIWMYFLIGWGAPLMFVVVSIAATSMQNVEIALRTNETCFFSYRDGSIWYFVAPVLVVMLINTGVLLRVIVVVVNAAKIQAGKDSSEKAYQAKAGLRSALLLVPLLGCSYIIGFFVSFCGAFEFMYNVINSLQGFFIALLYCALNKEVRAAILKYIKRSKEQNSIQASTTGSAFPKSWPETVSKSISSSRNQVAPEPIKQVYLEDVD